VLLLVLVMVGFNLFYFHGRSYPGRPITPPIRTLIITHGTAMLLWILLAIVQPFLVATGNRKLHMTLGRIGAVIAGCLVVLGMKLGIESCRVSPPDLMHGPMNPKQFMAIPVLTIVLFAMMVAVGIWFRKRPEIHRPIMFFASLAVVGAAIARIDFFNHLYAGTIFQKLWGEIFFTVVIGAVFLVAKCVVFRKFDRWFALAYGVVSLWFLMTVQGALTPVWDGIATFLLKL